MTPAAFASAARSDRRFARSKRWIKPLGALVGLALLVAAVVVVAGRWPAVEAALARIQHAPTWALLTLIAAPVFSLLAASESLRLLTGRFGSVGRAEMLALVASAWLLNALPLRPGMVGRLAYHRKYNGVAVRDSLRVLVESMLISAVVACTLLLFAALPYTGAPASLAPAGALALVALPLAFAARPGPRRAVWLAVAWRSADMLVWCLRYAALFAAVGVAVTPAEAVLLASVSQLAMAAPVGGNGLGLREWAVALTVGAAASAATEVGLAAELANRAVETLLSLPLGIAGIAFVGRRISRERAGRPAGPATGASDNR